MIEHGKSDNKYFIFGTKGKCHGTVMPEATIKKILENGCFEETFDRTLQSDRCSVDETCEDLTKLRDNLLAGAHP